ncbi:MAG: 4Fe-4S binding protein, partial [Actinomycetota bacterium]|nr:4Fe-4S binding protein [Actinomycetota bacterium]
MRTVAVASGKGGTGKTTVTGLFAHLASKRHTVGLTDADVEASNLPIALRVGDVQSSPFAGNPRAVVDAALCTACGLCAEVCRFAAISATSFGPPVFDPLSCEGCGRCANLCPADAIAMHPGVAGEACLG